MAHSFAQEQFDDGDATQPIERLAAAAPAAARNIVPDGLAAAKEMPWPGFDLGHGRDEWIPSQQIGMHGVPITHHRAYTTTGNGHSSYTVIRGPLRGNDNPAATAPPRLQQPSKRSPHAAYARCSGRCGAQ